MDWEFDLSGQREKIRTSDPYHPKVVRYQAALHAEAQNYSRATRHCDWILCGLCVVLDLFFARMQTVRTAQPIAAPMTSILIVSKPSSRLTVTQRRILPRQTPASCQRCLLTCTLIGT